MKEDKKNARPDAATSERATETGATYGADSSSQRDNNTSSGTGQIAALLNHGQENAVTRTHLEKLTGLDGRTIRLMIERERRAGALIISDNQHGYYLTDDPGEAQRFARSMKHRAREILRTARAIEGAAGLD